MAKPPSVLYMAMLGEEGEMKHSEVKKMLFKKTPGLEEAVSRLCAVCGENATVFGTSGNLCGDHYAKLLEGKLMIEFKEPLGGRNE